MPCLHLLNRTFSDSERISAKLKPYFFDNLGKLSPNKAGDGSDRRFNDVLRHRFLIQGLVEQLRASVDFLVELCHSVSPNATRNTSLQLAALEQQKANDKMQKEKLHNKILQLDAKPRN
ncbi:hypothetical protein CUMW_278180 [Citrus unshiu]|uniref:Uncharacterized protein n=1 Tax=Citrus unshiu TaxID=55188 RepID=A0A2H5N595_CITUN|nr:hypothetical protein CUMW_278180 [Citrus unshiu]